MHLHGRDVQEYMKMTRKERSLVEEIYKEADMLFVIVIKPGIYWQELPEELQTFQLFLLV